MKINHQEYVEPFFFFFFRQYVLAIFLLLLFGTEYQKAFFFENDKIARGNVCVSSVAAVSFFIEKDFSPPLLRWPDLQMSLRNAKCSSTVYGHHLLYHQLAPQTNSTSILKDSSQSTDDPVFIASQEKLLSLPLVCRKPIAVIITDANPEKCPTCQLFFNDVLSLPHLEEFNIVRDSLVSVVVHTVGERPSHVDRKQQQKKNAYAKRRRRFFEHDDDILPDYNNYRISDIFFTDMLERFPISYPLEEDWSLALSQNSSLFLPFLHYSRLYFPHKWRISSSLFALISQAAAEYWRRVRSHPYFKSAWEKSYRGEGEYSLRILFLWPHNGSVMPITNPEWAMYAPLILEEEVIKKREMSRSNGTDELRSKHSKSSTAYSSGDILSTRQNKKIPSEYSDIDTNALFHSPKFSEHGIGAHLYISASAFLKNALLASDMVKNLLLSI